MANRKHLKPACVGAILLAIAVIPGPHALADSIPAGRIDQLVASVNDKVVNWRRHIHQNPELANREFKTAALVARHLEELGLEVRTEIGITGVVGLLHGKAPGRVIALRADMDALPVKEMTGLPFASTAVAEYNGMMVPVMHACGHDAHTAMLMGAAEVMSALRDDFTGTVMFLFQPAEEGAPAGEEGGAQLMMKEGVFDNPRPDAILGLHLEPGPLGQIQTRPEGFLPSATSIGIRLRGRQTHAARPWEGTDLINLAADIVKSVTTLSARHFDVFQVPNVVTIATINAGNRGNILPGVAAMSGTLRTYSSERAEKLKENVREIVLSHARLYGATAEVEFHDVAVVTHNDPDLLRELEPALREAAGAAGFDGSAPLRGAAEDFSFFQEEIPGVYAIIGATRDFENVEYPAPNHSPQFDIDEDVLQVGVRTHVLSALRFLQEEDRD